ncbi:Insulin-like growth factor-binding protein 3 receptor [Camelus dromedarius]|uniref:Insulin-like growth factor-binding protein 3 receptor isoform X1 n=3 Tax=Camelus TaxID=9836 RepID=A0A8B8RH18_CAMFR|nr:insulin-like growth factor-binding protein 3 receptor isoform X1 [Camelus ferus]XP_010994484.2 insulin-like growth factor-binding protein 3 receptor isoform X2 [Camelus dromedarius]XP_031288798.1 insulin-like growth factor-binding protein 3 receptor isoform X2 [Camelus dromedarius]XP_031288799.1 insulin-like growth factor-binding protein 3 receptor isoform X2 [Camelus dromedarius]XP_032316389.1 insulin-like growth factor-binding protein 3 receptor isoform X1 [Camelus ferus]XP_032316390.1 in
MGKCLLTGRLLSRSLILSSSRLSLEAQTPLLPMGSCQAGHNLHLCLAHHPPLVCATFILLLLGLSGLGLGVFLLTHRTGLRSPDIPQDWVSFLRSFGHLTLCPVNGTVTDKWHGSHVVGLLTTLNFEDGPDRNKTQTFQAMVQGSHVGLTGSSAEELILITARVTTEKTPGTCLYFSSAPGILPSSQPPMSCSEEGAGNATLSREMAEECVSVWSREGLVLTKLLTSEELALCGSRLLVLGSFLLLFCGLLCYLTAVYFHPRRESHWSRTRL